MPVQRIDRLGPFLDSRGNSIEAPEMPGCRTSITFQGENNRIRIHPNAKLARFTGAFHGSNAVVTVGAHAHAPAGRWHFRVGDNSEIRIEDDVSCTDFCFISAVEGARVVVGKDCMIAIQCQIRSDDAHPIYDVETGRRVNPSRDVVLGEHVWLGAGASVLSGVSIGDGSVIGTRAVVTRTVPNNAIAAGNPAKVVRTNIAWERPLLSKGSADAGVRPGKHWRFTIRNETELLR